MKIAVILATLATMATVEAGWDCRCQSRYSTKRGINTICGSLDSNWTSRDCFLKIYGDCSRCTYDPAGDYDQASYNQLDSWCRSQSYVSNNLGNADFSLTCGPM